MKKSWILMVLIFAIIILYGYENAQQINEPVKTSYQEKLEVSIQYVKSFLATNSDEDLLRLCEELKYIFI